MTITEGQGQITVPGSSDAGRSRMGGFGRRDSATTSGLVAAARRDLNLLVDAEMIFNP